MGANITIYDNYSTDNSKQIILDAGCNLIEYDSGNQIRDDLYLSIKNECWKKSKADWVCIVDLDEFLFLDFNVFHYDVIKTQGYDMIGLPPSMLGVKNDMYSKLVMFRPKLFVQIGYQPGCHTCRPTPPIGYLRISQQTAPLLHYKYISEDYVIARHKMYQTRLSDFNKQYGFGIEYQNVEEQKIKDKFLHLWVQAAVVDHKIFWPVSVNNIGF